ncbi:MAG: hypothetical protein E6H09_13195 [Bacteroidetes bacterium]|nr:MAG: hypothetical protein E6H09_13195 [Bacteroidota bacterium]
MKRTNSITGDGSRTHVPLHQLVDEVVKDLSLSSPQLTGKSRVINQVATDLVINTCEETFFAVIHGMLHAIIANATEGDIQVSARELFGNTVRISVRDNNCYNTYAVACALQRIVPLAEQVGGFLNIMNQRQKITTVEFSFPYTKEDNIHGHDD